MTVAGVTGGPLVGGWTRGTTSMRAGRIYPSGHYAVITTAGMAPAPNRIAALFDLSAGTEMIRRQRVTHDATHTPLSWSESWFPAALAAACPVLLQRERIVEGTLRRIAAVGPEWVASRGVDEVTVAAADAGMAYTLHVPVGSPVLVTCTQWVTAAGRVVEVGGSTAVQGVCAAYPYEL